MIRRDPTRIELTLDDIQEYHLKGKTILTDIMKFFGAFRFSKPIVYVIYNFTFS